MAASGFNGRYGEDKSKDLTRSVTRAALPQALAAKLFYDRKMSTENVLDIPDEEWSSLSKQNTVSRQDVANYMRAYEHYQ